MGSAVDSCSFIQKLTADWMRIRGDKKPEAVIDASGFFFEDVNPYPINFLGRFTKISSASFMIP